MSDQRFTHTFVKPVHIFSQVYIDDTLALVSASVLVRRLFVSALGYLTLNDSLDESQYPYKLKKQGTLVCFSHCRYAKKTYVCLAIELASNTEQPKQLLGLGIDTEKKHISLKVMQRFFADEEKAFILALDADKQAAICQLLWMCKEAYIKAVQTTLTRGMGINMADFFYLDALLLIQEYTQPHIQQRCDGMLTAKQNANARFYWLAKHQSVLCLYHPNDSA